jgi:hypothetical protein
MSLGLEYDHDADLKMGYEIAFSREFVGNILTLKTFCLILAGTIKDHRLLRWRIDDDQSNISVALASSSKFRGKSCCGSGSGS